MYQELATTMPDLVKSVEQQMDTTWNTLEILESDDRIEDIILQKSVDADEFKTTVENCRNSLDRVTDLLGQEHRSLGWPLVVAAELNNLKTQATNLRAFLDTSTEVSDTSLESKMNFPMHT